VHRSTIAISSRNFSLIRAEQNQASIFLYLNSLGASRIPLFMKAGDFLVNPKWEEKTVYKTFCIIFMHLHMILDTATYYSIS